MDDTPFPPIRIFCSYTHADEKLRDDLGCHMAAMRNQGLIADWHDRKIPPGGEWDGIIKAELDKADIILLLVSAKFIASKYCQDVEVTRAMERHDAGSAIVIPVYLRPCDFKGTRFAKLQGSPKNAKPVIKWCPQDDAWVDVVGAIRKSAEELAERRRKQPVLPASIDISRLPEASGTLFGRATMFEALDRAWADGNTAILTLVAQGGTGKSVLVGRWLDQMRDRGWAGAEIVFGWSFYSQGADRMASADDFLDAALTFFGHVGDRPVSAWDKGVALAGLVASRRSLLILDGLEPLQYREHGPMSGRLKDQGIQALLRTLARRGQPGLCLITTRNAVTDLTRWEGEGRATRQDLAQLTIDAGADLLEAHGVHGDTATLTNLVGDFGGHALALALLAEWLTLYHRGKPERVDRLRPHNPAAGGDDHALRVLAGIAPLLSPAEAAVMAMVGLFDRPADPALIAALRDPPIVGLTERVEAAIWEPTLGSLRAARLLLAEEPGAALDAHPLVREFFARRLKATQPDIWRAAHSCLFDTLCAMAPPLPDTLAEMAPLFPAIRHGAEAGRAQEAFKDVLRERINRRNAGFAIYRLGAHGARLAGIAALFDDPWTQPSAVLSPGDQAFLLNSAGFGLRAVGRGAEALVPMQAALAAHEAREDWINASIAASNLSEMYLLLGEIEAAIDLAGHGVTLADRSGDALEKLAKMTTLANALLQAGRGAAADEVFVEAERMQVDRQPQYPFLYSLRGYQYCDRLLDRGEGSVVRRRAEQTREWVRSQGWLLDIALDTLSLGRAAHLAGDQAAARLLDQALDGLRRAGQIQFLPPGLLARAAFRLDQGALDSAAEDLDEAREIAEAGGMRLFLADVLLGETRLAMLRGQPDVARAKLDAAARLIDDTGYHRRDAALAALRAELDNSGGAL